MGREILQREGVPTSEGAETGGTAGGPTITPEDDYLDARAGIGCCLIDKANR